MAKKVKKSFLKILGRFLQATGIAALVTACPDPNPNPDPGQGPVPMYGPPVPVVPWVIEDVEFPFPGEDFEYEVGELSGNLISDGNADDGEAETGAVEYKTETGCTVEKVDGGASGQCLKVVQAGTGAWQEFYFDVTKFYGQGKSYLLSFKVKADPDAETTVFDAANNVNFASKDQALSVSYTVYSGDVKNWANNTEGCEHYDFEDGPKGFWGTAIVSPWGGPFCADEYYSEGLNAAGEDVALSANNTPLVTSEWKQYDYVISYADIESIVNDTGVYQMLVAFSMGPSAGGGYSYLLDDIVFKDLNIEVERLGQTAFATTGEDEGGDEGGEGAE